MESTLRMTLVSRLYVWHQYRLYVWQKPVSILYVWQIPVSILYVWHQYRLYVWQAPVSRLYVWQTPVENQYPAMWAMDVCVWRSQKVKQVRRPERQRQQPSSHWKDQISSSPISAPFAVSASKIIMKISNLKLETWKVNCSVRVNFEFVLKIVVGIHSFTPLPSPKFHLMSEIVIEKLSGKSGKQQDRWQKYFAYCVYCVCWAKHYST